jgi:polysaccharide pyruvyl transferase WcaK-like protein
VRILIDPGIYNLRNLGGVAMFQAAADRLRAVAPGAEICALTDDPGLLRLLCPDVRPLPRGPIAQVWADRAMLGTLHAALPRPLSRWLVESKLALRARWPSQVDRLTVRLLKARRHDLADAENLLDGLEGAGAIVISGAAGLNRHFPGYVRQVCALLEIGAARGLPVAMFGQAVGPMASPSQWPRLARALGAVDLFGLRERLVSPQLLRGFGVDSGRVRITGDDAVEMAYRVRRPDLGDRLGVSVRVADYTEVSEGLLDLLRTKIGEFLRRWSCKAEALPIAVHEAARDPEQIARILPPPEGEAAAAPRSPTDVIDRASACRAVVSGTYHGAVFALSQGIPVVCIAQSELYAAKFHGLAAEFGEGCVVVEAGEPAGLGQRLAEALDAAWKRADELRPRLLSAAQDQVERGWEAYRAFGKVAA